MAFLMCVSPGVMPWMPLPLPPGLMQGTRPGTREPEQLLPDSLQTLTMRKVTRRRQSLAEARCVRNERTGKLGIRWAAAQVWRGDPKPPLHSSLRLS